MQEKALPSMRQRIRKIEAKYGQPAEDVIECLKKKMDTFKAVEEELGLTKKQLIDLRVSLGMSLRSYIPLEKRIKKIEEEYGRPITEVLTDFRDAERIIDGGNAWETVAGCFNVSRDQLYYLRTKVGFSPDGERIHSPASRKPTPTDRKAVALGRGYEDGKDAVRDLKLRQKMTVKEIAAMLGVSEETVRLYTPEECKHHYNFSKEGRAVLAKQAERLGKDYANADHSWRRSVLSRTEL